MQERRTLVYIKEEDIPASAVAWDGTTTTSPSGNVFYIPFINSNSMRFLYTISTNNRTSSGQAYFPCFAGTGNTYCTGAIRGALKLPDCSEIFYGIGRAYTNMLYNNYLYAICLFRNGYPTSMSSFYCYTFGDYHTINNNTTNSSNSYVSTININGYMKLVSGTSGGSVTTLSRDFSVFKKSASDFVTSCKSIDEITSGWEHPIYIDTE